jgi:hypothetical protein
LFSPSKFCPYTSRELLISYAETETDRDIFTHSHRILAKGRVATRPGTDIDKELERIEQGLPVANTGATAIPIDPEEQEQLRRSLESARGPGMGMVRVPNPSNPLEPPPIGDKLVPTGFGVEYQQQYQQRPGGSFTVEDAITLLDLAEREGWSNDELETMIPVGVGLEEIRRGAVDYLALEAGKAAKLVTAEKAVYRGLIVDAMQLGGWGHPNVEDMRRYLADPDVWSPNQRPHPINVLQRNQAERR